MPRAIRLIDTLTYWAPQGMDGFGNMQFAAPVQITGRWENSKRLITDDQGNQVMTAAVVAVDQDVENEGFLFRGTSAAADPRDVDGAYRIVQYQSARSLVQPAREHRVATLGAT